MLLNPNTPYCPKNAADSKHAYDAQNVADPKHPILPQNAAYTKHPYIIQKYSQAQKHLLDHPKTLLVRNMPDT